MGDRWNAWIAVAGIVSGVVAGLGASTASYLTSRDANSSQRRLAQDDRLFAARSSAYIEGLEAEDEWILTEQRAGEPKFDAWEKRWHARLSSLRARIDAYAPDDTARAFNQMMAALVESSRSSSTYANKFHDLVRRDLDSAR